MIIKGFRVAARGVKALCQHLLHGDENDRIEILHGTQADLRDWQGDSQAARVTYAIRHFIVAPKEPITREQARRVGELLAGEFEFDEARSFLVEHAKPRAAPDAFDVHWHLCVPEVDVVSGKVLSSSHDRARHEFIARIAEVEFGHQVTPGAHDRAILARLRREGRNNLADILAGVLDQGADKPREAFSHADHQKGRRVGVDLPMLKQIVAEALKNGASQAALREELDRNGLALCPGERAGEWVVMKDDLFIASLRRLAGLRKAELFKLTEKWDVEFCSRPNGSRSGDPGGRRDAEEARGDRRRAEVAGGAELSANDDRYSGASGRRIGAGPGVVDGAASNHPGAGDQGGFEKGDLRGVIESVTQMATQAGDLHRKAEALAQSSERRIDRILARAEREAEARIDDARRGCILPKEPVERAARDAASATRALAAVQNRLDFLNAERSALREKLEKAPIWTRWRQEATWKARIGEIDIAREKLTARRIIADQHCLNAGARYAQVEKEHLAATIAAQKAAESAIAVQQEAIANLRRTRRVVSFWPAFAHLGPSGCRQIGRLVERTRRQLRDPNARDIWGIPLNFG